MQRALRLAAAVSTWGVSGLFLPMMAWCQATSPWLPVADATNRPADSFSVTTPTRGASYLTVEFVGASIYQNSNWWTSLVERNRRALLDVSVSGHIGGVSISDSRAAPPIRLRKSTEMVSIGWRQTILDRVPTTFDGLNLDVHIAKTATDGLDALIGGVAAISQSTPAITVSQSTLGIVTGSKAILDYLFNKSLVLDELRSTLNFPTSGNSLPAGYYAVLAADDDPTWQQYAVAPARGSGLTWDGSGLRWGGQALTNVSFFVVHVQYYSQVYAALTDALSYTGIKDWATLIELARREVRDITDQPSFVKVITDARQHLRNAGAVLDLDRDLVQRERDSLLAEASSDLQKMITDRAVSLSLLSATPLPGQPSSTNGPGRTRPPVVMMVDSSRLGERLRAIQREHPVADSVPRTVSP